MELRIKIKTDDPREKDLPDHLGPRRQPVLANALELQVIIKESQHRKPHHGEHRQKNIRIAQIRPQKNRQKDAADNKDASHGRGACLGNQRISQHVLPGPEHRLLTQVPLLELADQPWPDNDTDEKRCHRRHAGAERDVFKDIQRKKFITQQRQIIEHRFILSKKLLHPQRLSPCASRATPCTAKDPRGQDNP